MHPQPYPTPKQIAAARVGMKRRDFVSWLARRHEADEAFRAADPSDLAAGPGLASTDSRQRVVAMPRTERREYMRLRPDTDLRLSGGNAHPQGPRSQRRRRPLTPDQHARLDRETSRQRIADLRADGKPLPGQLTDPTFRQSASSRG